MTAARARFHHLTVERLTSPGVEDPLAHFFSDWTSADSSRLVDLTYRIAHVGRASSPPYALYSPSFYQDHIQAYVGPRGFLFWDGASCVEVDLAERTIVAELTDETLANVSGIEMLFDLVFALSLRMFGIFQLHAGAVTRGDACILIAGPSGAGKTTTTLAFTLHGWTHLTDERVFLRRRGGNVEMLCVREPLRVRNKTAVALACHLDTAGGREEAAGRIQVTPESYVLRHELRPGLPQALIFPQVASQVDTRAEPMGKAEALGHLLMCSALLAVPGAIAPAEHLQTLRDVVDVCSAWSAALGSDLLSDPAEVVHKLTALAVDRQSTERFSDLSRTQ